MGVRVTIFLTFRWTFSCSLMTKQKVSPEVRMGSEDEPLLWANRARKSSHQHYRQLPQHQRAAHSPQTGDHLCVFWTVVEREVAAQAQKFSSPFSIQFSPCLLAFSPLILGKPWVFPLPCLVDIFTIAFLCSLCHCTKCFCMARNRTYP